MLRYIIVAVVSVAVVVIITDIMLLIAKKRDPYDSLEQLKLTDELEKIERAYMEHVKRRSKRP